MSVSKLHSHTPLGTASEPPATRHRGRYAGIVYRLRHHPSKVKKRFRPPLPAPHVALAELAYGSNISKKQEGLHGVYLQNYQ